MPRRTSSRWAAASVGVLILLLAAPGCGSDEGAEQAGAPAPSPSDFPAANGRTTEELHSSATPTEELVVSPAGRVFREGTNRFGFGVFTAAREQVPDAEVAIYAGGPDKPATGPFPARIESLQTERRFTAQTTAADPDAPEVVYASDLELDRRGEWRLIALVREGDDFRSVRLPSIEVGEFEEIPGPGDRVPRVHTPTAEDVPDLSEIDTRDPHDTMHQDDLADVLGEKPVVLLFATPLLCQSRVCGPVVDIAEQVKADHGGDVAFIHMEIFEDNSVNEGLREQVRAFGLPTEPWLFVIDRDGRVSTAIEGAFGVEELETAVEKVSG